MNGVFSITFTSFFTEKNQHSFSLVQEESIVNFEDQEYRIKSLTEMRNNKLVTAQHIFFDLNAHWQYGITGGDKTVSDLFSFILNGSGWTFDVVDKIAPQLVFNFGEDNAVSLIRKACEIFNCEIQIEPNKHIKIFKEMGSDNDLQFRYKHNITGLKRESGSNDIRTVIKGYGGNGLQVEYRSPNISVYGELHAEPIRDENYITAESMIVMLKRELKDTPEVSIEVEAILLENAKLGDKVWLIYEPLGIEFQTRIMSIKRFPQQPSKSTVVLSNKKRKVGNSLTQATIKINENAKEFRTKIDQTNEQILLQAESVNESIATLQLKADNIQFGVTQLNGRMGNAESQINIQAGQISSKVSYSDYNGQTVSSMITQDPYAISMMAQNLNLQGLVTFTNLSTPGQTRIDGGNVYGERFVVGNGTGSTLTMTSVYGSHSLHSNDANGFRLSSNGSISLAANGGYGIYTTGAPLVAQSGFRVDGGSSQFNSNVTVNATLNASSMQIQGYPVATQYWVSNLISGLATVSYVNDQLRLKESQIVSWANNKFVAK